MFAKQSKVDASGAAVRLSETQFFEAAEGWHIDFVLQERKSKSVAWIIAGVSSGITCVAVLAVALMSPLKTVTPYVIRVDNSTGIVDVVKGMDGGRTTYDEAVTKYFLNQYVQARESYTRDTVYSQFNKVILMSDANERLQFKALYARTNPQSPLITLGEYGRAEARITNISFVAKNVAAVRYLLSTAASPNAAAPPVAHMIATVTFKYVETKMGEQARLINPLGFQITDYRNDPEVVGGSAPGLREPSGNSPDSAAPQTPQAASGAAP